MRDQWTRFNANWNTCVRFRRGSWLLCCRSTQASGNGDNYLVKFTADTNMARFATSLGRNLGRPVVIDKTGLAGNFHVELSFVPNTLSAGDASAAAPGPSIYDALERQLGLRLQAATVPVDVLVVDGAPRTPAGVAAVGRGGKKKEPSLRSGRSGFSGRG